MTRLYFPIISFQGDLRPVIPVGLTNPATNISLSTLCWIDSGCDLCLFPETLATDLGHNFTRGTVTQGRGVSGAMFNTYLHTNRLRIADQFGTSVDYRCPTYFTTSMGGWGLLGLKGFFSHFKVIIDYRNRLITLEEH